MSKTPITFKKTGIEWLPEVPGHWEVRRIKTFYQEIDERSSSGNEELLSVSHYTGVTPRRDSLEKEDDLLTNAATLEGYKKVAKGDLVINIMLAWNGSLGTSSFDGITSPAYCVYRCFEKFNPEYFGYLFTTNLFKTQFRRNSTGIIESRLRLYSDRFFSLFSLVPPKKEQDQIVQFIQNKTAQIQHFLSKKAQFIALLKEQRQSIINEAVTRGIDPGARMKDSGIEWLGKVPEGWEVRRLKNFAEIKGRIGFRGYTTEDLVDEGNGAFALGATHIKNGVVDLSSPVFISWDKYYESPEIMVKKDDILIVQRGSVGVIGFVQNDFGEMTINPSLVLIKNVRINREFLFYFLNSFVIQDEIKSTVTQTAVPMISQFQIGNFTVCNPPLPEQAQIITHIKSATATIDAAIEKAGREMDLMKEYKEALVAEAVTGRLKIKE
ncbi:MAG: restriction endonuclease subunit S [Saprospiraceae bacterium]